MSSILSLLSLLLQFYSLIIIIRVVITWLPIDQYSPAVRFLYEITEPVLAPIRSLLPQGMGLDFSPLIVLVLITVIQRLLIAFAAL